jgi:hypothetical protein
MAYTKQDSQTNLGLRYRQDGSDQRIGHFDRRPGRNLGCAQTGSLSGTSWTTASVAPPPPPPVDLNGYRGPIGLAAEWKHVVQLTVKTHPETAWVG